LDGGEGAGEEVSILVLMDSRVKTAGTHDTPPSPPEFQSLF